MQEQHNHMRMALSPRRRGRQWSPGLLQLLLVLGSVFASALVPAAASSVGSAFASTFLPAAASTPSSPAPLPPPSPLPFPFASHAVSNPSHQHVPLRLSLDMDGNGTMAGMVDEYDIGVSHAGKMGLWSTYVVVNFIGCSLCLLLIYSVVRLPSRSSSDVLVAGLCFACFFMSATCGIQCSFNLSRGHFAFGYPACFLEAVFHLTAILVMFFNLALLAFDSWRTVVHGKSFGVGRTLLILAAIWVFVIAGLLLSSMASPIYMADSGVFCFFAFDSPLMWAFVFPVFGIVAVATR